MTKPDPVAEAFARYRLEPDFESLLKLAGVLRGPEGCPWDRKQTLESLTKHLREELEETIAAAEGNDNMHLTEEIGDLLFVLAMYLQIAAETRSIEPEQVFQQAVVKYINRHTWVFGSDKIDSPEEAVTRWKHNKDQEKQR